MNIEQHFKGQLDSGATTMFFYGLENEDQSKVEIKSHKGTLSEFPATLAYIRHLSESMPLFKVSL
jgi:hypothetical protein